MPGKARLTREQIAQRTARNYPDGGYVNLGWGIPEPDRRLFTSWNHRLFSQREWNSGHGATRQAGRRGLRLGGRDEGTGDAGSGRLVFSPGRCAFDDARRAFDVAVLGGFQVSEKGDLAN
jgi:acyl CoA:acetate/3-ketoacid CoA transferase beta subunit